MKNILVAMIFLFVSGLSHSTEPIEKAHLWLKSQLVPNKIVPKPFSGKEGMILSYHHKKTNPDYKYIFSKSNLYDNALAIIAFSMLKDFQSAEKVIKAIQKNTQRNGDIWFNFNTHNYWPNSKDKSGAIIRVGAMAWYGYALTFYINSLQDEQVRPDIKRHLEKVTNAVLRRQVLIKKDLRYGLITGGEGTYKIEKKESSGKLEEVFYPGTISWCSIEHNIDTYFFLRDSGKVLKSKKIKSAAKLLERSLLSKAWNRDLNQFNRGQNIKGPDPVEALDTASWGALFLNSIGEKEKASIAVEKSKSFNYKPYRNFLVYEEENINKMIYPKSPAYNWNEVDMIWLEGAFGVVMAQLKIQGQKASKEHLEKLSIFQNSEGAFPYSTKKIAFQFTDSPSVASTAWFIMVYLSIENKEINDLFWK